MEGSQLLDNHKHKDSKEGRGAKEKKKDLKAKKEGTRKERHNHRAFSVANVVRTQRTIQRNLDRSQKKEYVPLDDRRSSHGTETPPPLVVVMGPAGVGKSSLIRSLVKFYTNQNLTTIKGPITVVTGKKSRITLLECPNDTASMLDCAKVADLVLLCVDAKFGFEMETFEFLNILQTHGFPKVVGVFTHLDQFQTVKNLRKTKKLMKHRFWTEIYDGAKMFYFSGIVNGKYLKNEVKQLTLAMSRMKFRPLVWRNTHPYILVDRHEDITSPNLLEQDESCERSVTFYGYVRGSHMKEGHQVHLIGVGDFQIADISVLDDPCPAANEEEKTLKKKKSSLFAPHSNVGAVQFDKDAIYIDIGRVNYTKGDDIMDASPDTDANYAPQEPAGMLKGLQKVDEKVDEKMHHSGLRLFRGSKSVVSTSHNIEMATNDGTLAMNITDESDGGSGQSSVDSDSQREQKSERSLESDSDDDASHSSKGVEDDDEDESDDSSTGSVDGNLFNKPTWKTGIADQAKTNYLNRKNEMLDLQSMIYDKKDESIELEDSESSDASDDEFFTLKKTKKQKKTKRQRHNTSSSRLEETDSSRATNSQHGETGIQQWLVDNDDSLIETLRDQFVTGDWNGADGKSDEGSEYSDFEDLETGEQFDAGGNGASEDAAQDEPDASSEEEVTDAQSRLLNSMRKAGKRKEVGDSIEGETGASSDGDDDEDAYLEALKREKEAQLLKNKEEFGADNERSRLKYEGFRQGLYCRVKLNAVPGAFLDGFDASRPLILGGLTPQETKFGFTRCRLKKHRWHKKILKCNDPLVFSIGWRRFQSIPIYSTEDQNGRHRYLKYTPEHLHCYATFYGPQAPPNSGLLAIQNMYGNISNFRVAATGTALELDANFPVVKKLKLVGTPSKIYRNTAFISGMFNSDLEVSRFEGASIKTVSGIRGQIKKAIREGQPGSFRAAFEDKILLSDIVFCRTWVPVKMKEYYNPVTNHTTKLGTEGWQGMKRKALLQLETNTPIEVNPDSIYKPIERTERKFNKLHVPKKLEEALPFASKPKNETARKKKGYVAGRAVVMEKEEKRKHTFLQALSTIRSEKTNLRARKKLERKQKQESESAKTESIIEAKRKVNKKRQFRMEGKRQKGRDNKRMKEG